jgi:cyclopropane fatty-acyl-phospholipid synthase-like methyltransferase
MISPRVDDKHTGEVSEFYNTTHYLFQIHSLGDNEFHYGFWEDDTKTSSEASRNTTKFVANCLDLNKQDKVLDAGCGMGGTTIFLAQEHGCEIVGITISEVQWEKAKKEITKYSVNNQIAFFLRDFRDTGFEDSSFTKIFAIESVCYSTRKIAFLRESYRLLEKGGRLAVCDAFLLSRDLSAKEEEYHDKFLNGFAIPNLSTKVDFEQDLFSVGFQNVRFYDKSREVKKSSQGIYRVCLLSCPFGWLFHKFRIIPKSVYNIFIGGIYQKIFGDTGKIIYGVFVADK